MTYKRLTDELANCWNKPWAELSVQQRGEWFRARHLVIEYSGRSALNVAIWHPVPDVGWDEVSPDWRMYFAKNHDAQYDPDSLEYQQIGFYRFDKPASLAAISALEAANLMLIREGVVLDRLGIPCITVEAPQIARQLLNAVELRVGKAIEELIQVTYHPLAEWLWRAKANDIDYLPALDLAVTLYRQQKASGSIAHEGSEDRSGASGGNAWNCKHPDDPDPKQSWYSPARYFARELIAKDSSLQSKKGSPSVPGLLPRKVGEALSDKGIKKCGGKGKLSDATILKAFTNVDLSKPNEGQVAK